MRQKDVWHLKFRDSEIYIWCHVSEFNLFRGLISWRKLRGLGWMLPSGRRLPHHRLKNLLSELQSLPWFRSVELGFGCCGLWFEFRMLGEVLARICRAGFSNYARIWEFVSSSVQGGSDTLLLCGLLLVWISSALRYLWLLDIYRSLMRCHRLFGK